MTRVKLIRPTAAEDAAINAGIAADPDTYELSDEEFKKLRPAITRGRPKSDDPKEHVNLRLDAEVLTFFRALGRGWQTSLNAALAAYVNRQRPRQGRMTRSVYTTDSLPAEPGGRAKKKKNK